MYLLFSLLLNASNIPFVSVFSVSMSAMLSSVSISNLLMSMLFVFKNFLISLYVWKL